MALTADEQRYYDFAKAALPPWVPDPDEFLMGAAKLFGGVHAITLYLFGNALISTAIGATSSTPDWLNQHAADRGTRRILGEDDPTLRKRLRTFPDALTRAALLSVADAQLAAAGVAGSSAMVELPRDCSHSGEYVSDTGVGGTFTKVGTVVTFTPSGSWAAPPFRDPSIVPVRTYKLTIAGALTGGNNGTRVIDGLTGNGAHYVNAGGAAQVDPTVVWTVKQYDPEGNLRDGFTRAYSQRGYRSSRLRPQTIVIILPYGTSAIVAASVAEAVRQRKAAGIVVKIERRQSPP
jgi:hypothetical protein